MKNLISTCCLLILLVMTGWAQTGYVQFETSYMTPKPEYRDMVMKSVGAHAKKYHASDPYKMWAFEVVTGPHAGSFFVALGPSTFTQLDSRPSSPEHDADWTNNITKYLADEDDAAYWRLDTTMAYRAAGSENFGKSRLRWWTIHPGEFDRFKEQMEKVNAVYKAKNYKASWNFYSRYGASTGPHACTEINFDNWAYLDNQIDFEKAFEEVHGQGSFDRFLDEIDIAADQSKTYDELLVFVPEMSSPQ